MKKIISLLLISLIIISLCPASFAEELSWEKSYRQVIINSSGGNYVLLDITDDGVPELVCENGAKVLLYYYKDGGAVKGYEGRDIPFEFFKNLTLRRENKTAQSFFMGQAVYLGKIMTYKMSFLDFSPVLEVIAEENPKTHEGMFKGNDSSFKESSDVITQVLEYMSDYTEEYLLAACLENSEIRKLGRTIGAKEFTKRYRVISSFADDSRLFSANQRERIKKSVGMGKFLSFDKISVLSDDYIFIEFYVNNTEKKEYAFNYDKRYALISGDYNLVQDYKREQDIDSDYLESLISVKNSPSNFNPDYEKTNGFRGIDDYVTYFSSLLNGEINEKGKKEVANFMEYAANKCSRTEVKAQNNTVTVKKDTAAFVADSAVNCMGQLVSVCNSKNLSQIRMAKAVPELVCSGLDMSKPVRIEFENSVAAAINKASGIRIMLDKSHGIYVNSAELAVLEKEIDVFSIEYTKNEKDYSIVFTGKNNEVHAVVSMPVWFILPATSKYSSVGVSYEGGTENRGGQFDEKTSTIEFSATHSGNYHIVEDDITINDIDSVTLSANEAIRFLVSKGIFEVDRNKNFYPEQRLTKYEFTKALVKMFYSEKDSAVCSYPDVKEGNKYYKYVATAQELGLTGVDDSGNFNGNDAVTNEYIISLCAKVLTEKKGYSFPENYNEYLSFSDKDTISEGAKPYIAVAVQCGFVENTGAFLPKAFITRGKGAEVLYEAFMLLYDTSPVTTSFLPAQSDEQGENSELKDLTPLARVGICLVFTGALLLAFFLIDKKKNKR